MTLAALCPNCRVMGGCICGSTYGIPPQESLTQPEAVSAPMGCICPPEANLTCANPFCPRKPPVGLSTPNHTKEES